MSDPHKTEIQAINKPTSSEKVLILVVPDLHFDELIGAGMNPLHAIGVSPISSHDWTGQSWQVICATLPSRTGHR